MGGAATRRPEFCYFVIDSGRVDIGRPVSGVGTDADAVGDQLGLSVGDQDLIWYPRGEVTLLYAAGAQAGR